MMLYCCGCQTDVDARLTDGMEVYPHRHDLASLPFWKCDACGNFVGCHHKIDDRTRPLGCIPTPKIKNARKHIHALIDPVWQKKILSRRALYKKLSGKLGWSYHTAKIRSVEEARDVYKYAREIINEIHGLRNKPV